MGRKARDAGEPARSDAVAAEVNVKPSPPPRRVPGNRFVRWFVNVLVLAHFTAVLSAAGSVGPTSELLVTVWQPFRPYLQALYLNQGYNFYAPQPSASTLVAYEVVRADGTIVRGRIDDRPKKPRLLYHRYLLLTEHLTFASPESARHWYEAYAHHLCHQYGGSRVSLTRIIHYPATTEMIRAGLTLNEPMSYEETFAGEYPCGEY